MKGLKHELFSYVLPVFLPAVGVGWVGGSVWVAAAALAAGIVANLAGYSQGLNRGSEITSTVWKREFERVAAGEREP